MCDRGIDLEILKNFPTNFLTETNSIWKFSKIDFEIFENVPIFFSPISKTNSMRNYRAWEKIENRKNDPPIMCVIDYTLSR